MEGSEKRKETEVFLEGLVKEWRRLFSCQESGIGIYRFDRGKYMELEKVAILMRNLKNENTQLRKDHGNQIARLQEQITQLKKRR